MMRFECRIQNSEFTDSGIVKVFRPCHNREGGDPYPLNEPHLT